MHILKTFSPLLKEPSLIDDLPVVARITKFDEASAKAFSSIVSKAQNTGQPVLPVIIDSYGGQVYSLMSMISNIKHSRIPVATIIEGKAMSCGAILFSFGEEGMRYIDPDATVMIHEVSAMAWDKKGHADWFLDADECLKHGLANHAKIPELKIDTRVSFKFE